MTRIGKRTLLALAALLAALPFSSVALAQVDEFGDEPEAEVGVIQTVARVSYLQGTASYARGDEPDDWQTAALNVPMTLGDRVYTGRKSRLELQVHGGDTIWIGSRTDLVALNLTDDTKQYALKLGIASFRVRQLDENDVFEVDTPNAAVTFESAGDYRLRVDEDGNTRVSVERGNLTVATGGGQVSVNAGEEIVIDGIDYPRYDFVAMSSPDAWDRWVDSRTGRARRSAAYHYVSSDIVGAEDLDDYGSWDTIPSYGMAWSPARVEVGWTPYRLGHWVWQDPWGWTWISTEPWGWAPYHYGRWVTYSSRWFWVPVAPAVRVVAYAPALVAFVGAGPGFSASVAIGGGGYVGWFPLAPREPYVPWWSRRPAVNVNVTNVTYINKTYVTVVNQNTFVSGGVVSRSVVTDRTVIRQVETSQVMHGTVPVLPTLASTRVSVRSGTAAARPPAAVVARPVVARVAPPPAPPRFQQKLELIRQDKRPVDAYAAARLTTQAQREPKAAVAVRPAASEGRVTLSPRQGASSATAARVKTAPAPVSAAPDRGRTLATAQRPVAAEPVTARKPGEPRPERARPQEAQSEPAESRPKAAPVERADREPAVRPTPAFERESPERRVSPQTRTEVERQRPTPKPQAQARPVAPEREEPAQTQARKQAEPKPNAHSQSQQGRVVTPPAPRAVVTPDKKEREQPAASSEHRSRPTAKPRTTPKKDDKKDDDSR